MKKTAKKQQQKISTKLSAQKSEEAMIAGILEGSPEGIGVAVIRLDCGCRKMAAVDRHGDPASKLLMFRDQANSICEKCKSDQGAFSRVKEQFIHWVEPAPDEEIRQMIEMKVLGEPISH